MSQAVHTDVEKVPAKLHVSVQVIRTFCGSSVTAELGPRSGLKHLQYVYTQHMQNRSPNGCVCPYLRHHASLVRCFQAGGVNNRCWIRTAVCKAAGRLWPTLSAAASSMSTSAAASSTGSRRKSGTKLSQPQHDPTATKQSASAVQQGQYTAADAAMYKEMREALADFDSNSNIKHNTANTDSSSPREKPAARQKAFYAALRSVLGQVVDESTEDARHTRLAAAHQWYIKHKPRPKPRDMDMAAAMAASISVTCPMTDESSEADTSAAEDYAVACEAVDGPIDTAAVAERPYKSPRSSSRAYQQHQQQQFVLYGMHRQTPQEKLQQQQQGAGDVGSGSTNSNRADRYMVIWSLTVRDFVGLWSVLQIVLCTSSFEHLFCISNSKAPTTAAAIAFAFA